MTPESAAVLDAVERDAEAYGGGYVHIVRDANGNYIYRRLDPFTVQIRKRDNTNVESETERVTVERSKVL